MGDGVQQQRFSTKASSTQPRGILWNFESNFDGEESPGLDLFAVQVCVLFSPYHDMYSNDVYDGHASARQLL